MCLDFVTCTFGRMTGILYVLLFTYQDRHLHEHLLLIQASCHGVNSFCYRNSASSHNFISSQAHPSAVTTPSDLYRQVLQDCVNSNYYVHLRRSISIFVCAFKKKLFTRFFFFLQCSMCVAGNVLFVGGSDVCCCVPWYTCDVSPALLTPFSCYLSKQATTKTKELEDFEYLKNLMKWKIPNISGRSRIYCLAYLVPFSPQIRPCMFHSG